MDSRSRDWERAYRNRWQHDRVVRSTHGVNCTGSCSWKVHVKQGIVTWETQQTDYPENGPDVPDYEPARVPAGSKLFLVRVLAPADPLPVRPSARSLGALADRARADRRSGRRMGCHNSGRSRGARCIHDLQRGKGGFVRASWDEVADLVAAAHVHTIRKWGPDRAIGFSPIPAMSMTSYAAGSRYFSLTGGVLDRFDWYADLPPASPQIWGDQTDVPESADWWNATYLMMWGSNVPMTRTPDAHFMTEARYGARRRSSCRRTTSDNTKFADEWLAAHPGTDAALAMGWRTLCYASSCRPRGSVLRPTTRAASPTCRSS